MFNPVIGGLLLTFVESLLGGDQICRPIISKGSGCFHSARSTGEPTSLTGMQGRRLGWNWENRKQVMLVHFPLRAGILSGFILVPPCLQSSVVPGDPGFFQSASRVETVLLVLHVLCKHRTLCCLWINHWAYMSYWIPQSQVSFLTYLFVQDLLRKGTTGIRSN